MVRRTLLEILDELTGDELRTFVFHMQGLPRPPSPIPRGKLENVSRVELAELLLKFYPGKELQLVAQVLHEVPRRDLLRKFHLRRLEETIRTDDASGSHLQELQLSVSENTREATPRTDDLVETTPVQRPVSQQDQVKLAKNLGKNWRAIGIEYLGVTTSRIEQIEQENPGDAVMRNFYMLNDWKNREGERATPDRLYHILAQVPLDHDAIEFLRNS